MINRETLAEVVRDAAARWTVEAEEAGPRGPCPLCFDERSWIGLAPELAGLPHAVVHEVTSLLDADLRALEDDADEAALDQAWLEPGEMVIRADLLQSLQEAAEYQRRQLVLELLAVLQEVIIEVRTKVIEPRIANYLAVHRMTEPPWPWTLS